MKRTVLIFSLILFQNFYSQMVVSDPGATAQLAQTVTMASKSLSQLDKTYKVLKNASEKVEQVNSAVQQANHLQNIINKQKDAIKTANQILLMSKKRKIDLAPVTQSLREIQGSINTVQALLRNGIFNMNDADRLKQLDNEMNKASSAQTRLKILFIRNRYR